MSSVHERQAVLRALYAARPEAAMIVKRVRAGPADGRDPFHRTAVPENLAHPGQPCEVEWRCGPGPMRPVGGLHCAINPGEVRCGAVAACFDGTIRMIAAHFGIGLRQRLAPQSEHPPGLPHATRTDLEKPRRKQQPVAWALCDAGAAQLTTPHAKEETTPCIN
jgi:hypothetical protein